jgi:protein mago nashi
MQYVNNSNYKSDTLIKKEVYLSAEVVNEIKNIVKSSNVLNISDDNWDNPDKFGKQCLELEIDGVYKKLLTNKIGSYSQVTDSKDPDGLGKFYYLIQDLKCFVFSLISLNFRVKPVQA